MSREGDKTLDDWLALPEDSAIELIAGGFVDKGAGSFAHGLAVGGAMRATGAFGSRRGGWWLATSVDIQLGDSVVCPDIAGWRRDLVPSLPGDQRPLPIRPVWIGEIVGESSRAHDTITKVRVYHAAGVPHFWLLDPQERTLTVHRHAPDGYLVVLAAEAHERVRAEPFDAIELLVGVLLGDDPE